MADDRTVVVSWDRGGNTLVADPDPLVMEKGKRNVKITWEPGDAVASVDDIEFVGPTDDQFFEKVKKDGTVSVKDKNSKKSAAPKGYEYKITATRRDGAVKDLDPFVENDP